MAEIDYGILEACVKRDAAAYREDFLKQYRHFESEYEVFMLKPPKGDAENKAFAKLVQFIGFCSDSYPEDIKDYPKKLGDLLEKQLNVLDHSLRAKIVRTLIVMRNNDLLSPTDLLALFFKLFRCHDKSLRSTLYNHIVSDITNVNKKKRYNALNRTLVNFMYTMLEDQDPTAAKKSLDVMIELYKRRVWTDAKTVNAIAGCVFSSFAKMRVSALQFFLNIDSDEEQRAAVMKSKVDFEKETRRHIVTRKTRSKVKQFKQAKAQYTRMLNGEGEAAPPKPNWPAIELVFDPHGYAKKLLGLLKRCNDGFDVKIMLMNFISRLIAAHKIILVGFYPYMQRYLRPRQDKVTHMLAIVAQASHEMVPPEVLQPVVRTIANEFIHEGSAEEIVATGMNALQAICRRCPLVMDQDLLRDLAQYKSSKDRAVMASARSLIQLYRETNPALLAKKDRGRGTKDVDVAAYGEEKVSTDVEGIELLQLVKDILAGKIHSKAAGRDIEDADDDDDDKKKKEKKEGEKEEENDDDDDDDESDTGMDGWEFDSDEDEEIDDEDDEEEDENEDDDEEDEEEEEEEKTNKKGKGKGKEEEEEDDDEEGWKNVEDEDGTIEISENEDESENEGEEDDDDDDDDDEGEEEEDDDDDEEEEEEEEDDDDDEEDDEKPRGKKRGRDNDDDESDKKGKKKQRQEGDDGKTVAKDTSAPSTSEGEKDDHVALHILSQTDLMLLQKLKKLAAEDPTFIKSLKRMSRYEVRQLSKDKKKKSGSDDEDSDDEAADNGLYVTPEDIAAAIKSKMTRQERIAALAESRKEVQETRDAHKITRGRSKKVIARNKNYLMKLLGKRNARARAEKEKRKRDLNRKKRFRGHFTKRFGKNKFGH